MKDKASPPSGGDTKRQRNGFNVPTRLLDEVGVDEMIDHPDRITFWLTAMIHSARSMTEGVIKGAVKISPQGWMARGILCPPSVGEESGLWTWDGDDLVLNFYDHAGHRQYMGRERGGASRGRQKKEEAEEKQRDSKRVRKKTAPPNGGAVSSKHKDPKDSAQISRGDENIANGGSLSTGNELVDHSHPF